MKSLKLLTLATTALGLSFVTTAYAKEAVARKMAAPQDGSNCSLVENANIGINFSNQQISLSDAKDYMSKKREEVEAAAAQMGIEDLDFQNINYSIYNHNNGVCNIQNSNSNFYQLNGNMSFQLQDSEKATDLMEKLGDLGYNVNLNMNAYRQCQ